MYVEEDNVDYLEGELRQPIESMGYRIYDLKFLSGKEFGGWALDKDTCQLIMKRSIFEQCKLRLEQVRLHSRLKFCFGSCDFKEQGTSCSISMALPARI